jgi:2-iminobutanoate/2-iminopropanoate deaminase
MAVIEISTKNVARPIAPYSQATRVGHFIFVSGCLGLCSMTGKMKMETICEEVTLALDNLENVLAAAGAVLSDVAKLNVFVDDMSVMAEVNEIYKTRFSAPFPARTAVAVKELPMGHSC